ncbi:hypothetical protein BH789_gp114 [Gordonia phage GMA6]|uniref:Uncharacterized protein n=1 Tax=Gordonia phage GMA6 TaxID=1647285 RepID=A0A0K0NKY8_9CAUD|nr:hypothetical protein BH789_gp114 [Gordonia phage GMA6]AKL88395.1 hypothetical protein GMA6_114 [Gordonia phage GMA6]
MKVSRKFDKKTMNLKELKQFIETAEAAGCTPEARINVVEGFKVRTLEAEMQET